MVLSNKNQVQTIQFYWVNLLIISLNNLSSAPNNKKDPSKYHIFYYTIHYNMKDIMIIWKLVTVNCYENGWMVLSVPSQTIHTHIYDESFNIYDNQELKIISTIMQTIHGKPMYAFCCFFFCFGILCLSIHLMHFRKFEWALKIRRSNLVPLKWNQIL